MSRIAPTYLILETFGFNEKHPIAKLGQFTKKRLKNINKNFLFSFLIFFENLPHILTIIISKNITTNLKKIVISIMKIRGGHNFFDKGQS